MTKTNLCRFGVATLTCIAGLSGVASGATSSAAALTELEEIVVTAQRREEKLQDVPIPMSVTTAEQIQRDQINSLNDLARISPALEINRTFGGENNGGGRIRGLGTASFSGVGSVAFVVDGIPQGDLIAPNIFDIAQIEVLRGPQGTLFGQTASAGVINQTTVAPDPNAVSGSVRTELSDKGTLGSEFGRQIVRAAINLPLAGSTAIRVSTFVTRTAGSQNNVYLDKANRFVDTGLRARLASSLSENLTFNLIADYSYSTRYGEDFFTYATAPVPSNPKSALLRTCGVTPGYGNIDYCSARMADGRTANYGISGKFDWELGGHTLTSVSAWRRLQSDLDYSEITRLVGDYPYIWFTSQNNARNQFVQEVRLTSATGGRVDYVAGIYFSKADFKNGVGPRGGGFNLTAFVPPPFGPGEVAVQRNSFTPGSSVNTSKALFGDVTLHVSDKFRVFGGLRFTDQELEGTSGTNSGTRSDNNLSGRMGVAYRTSEALMIYGSVARGYKSPFFSVSSNPSQPATFIKGELPLAYELGAKASFLDNRLAVNGNVFHVDVKDFQGQQCVVLTTGANAGTLQCTPINVSSVVSKGVELDVIGSPTEGSRLNAGLLYNSVVYPSGFIGSDSSNSLRYANIGGAQLALAPKYKMTMSAEFSRALGGAEGFLSVNPVWKSKVRFSDSTNPVYDYPAHWQVGATLGIRNPDGKWGVSLFGRNITKEREPVVIFGGDAAAGLRGWPNADVTLQQVGINLDARF